MAYTAPGQYSHGDKISGAILDRIPDGLEAIYAKVGDAAMNPAAALVREQGPNAATYEGSDFYFIHKFRYLVFRSSGLIVDPAGLEDDVSLSDEDDYTIYDLDTVSWLVYGGHYRVTGVNYAFEVEFVTEPA